MKTLQQETVHARTDSTHHPAAPGQRRAALRLGATALVIVGLSYGFGFAYSTSSGAVDLGWVTPADAPWAAAAIGLVAVMLALAVSMAFHHRAAPDTDGHPAVSDGKRRRILRRPGRRTERAVGKPSAASGCPVAHGSGQAAPGAGPAAGGSGFAEVDRAEAEEFLRMFHAEHPEAGPVEPRLDMVRRELDLTGSYRHTPQELAFGARAAWRNNARCIGRLYWRSLQVRDRRTVSDAAGVARACVEHLDAATNGGRIRPVITIFPPETPDRPAPRIWNEQLIRYAGYELPDGGVLGDPRYRGFTRELIQRGWRPPLRRTAFDVLPLVVETAEQGARMFPLPASSVLEVELEHPDLRWFTELGMRWHAVPVISSNRLVIGGVSYPAAPFNGWYMGTEIGARNLGDSVRYDLVPEVAKRMGLDTSDEATLWRDQALVEINRAVLHSFRMRDVAITDHHTEAARFLTHLEREERAGRTCPADWTWIVPPMSGSLTPVFHRYYDDVEQRPNFFGDADATRRALEGSPAAFG